MTVRRFDFNTWAIQDLSSRHDITNGEFFITRACHFPKSGVKEVVNMGPLKFKTILESNEKNGLTWTGLVSSFRKSERWESENWEKDNEILRAMLKIVAKFEIFWTSCGVCVFVNLSLEKFWAGNFVQCVCSIYSEFAMRSDLRNVFVFWARPPGACRDIALRRKL